MSLGSSAGIAIQYQHTGTIHYYYQWQFYLWVGKDWWRIEITVRDTIV
jgi:hypothetical protein